MAEDIYNKDEKTPKANEKAGLFDWLIHHSKKIIIGVVVFALLISGGLVGVAFYQKDKNTVNPNVVAEVGGEKITKNQLNDKIYGLGFKENQSIDDVTKKGLIDELVEAEIINNATLRLGIIISNDEITKRAQENVPEYKAYTKRQQELVLKNAEFEVKRDKVKEKVIGWREGKFINIRFDKHFESLVGGTKEQIAADRKYAEDLANTLSSEIESNKITFEAAMDQVNNDKFIDMSSYPGRWPKQAREFGKDDHFFNYKEFKNKVLSMNESEMSKPFILEALNGGPEFSYIIVRVDKIQGGEAISYDEWLNKEKQALSVRRF